MSGLLEPSVKIEIEIQNQEKKGEACPVATGDVAVNLENREKAIEKANYGPMNPNESNMDYWREISRAWRIAPAQAKKSRCGNCAAFIQTPKMLACIESGLESNGEGLLWILDNLATFARVQFTLAKFVHDSTNFFLTSFCHFHFLGFFALFFAVLSPRTGMGLVFFCISFCIISRAC